MNRPEQVSAVRQVRLERRLPSYWRVTFDIPPINIFGNRPKLGIDLAALNYKSVDSVETAVLHCSQARVADNEFECHTFRVAGAFPRHHGDRRMQAEHAD